MRMQLNTLKPARGSKKPNVRVGRGIGSGKGKTCGRGHKGQHARTSVRQGHEGGQMPLHRRIPKFGFTSWQDKVRTEIRLSQITALNLDIIDLAALRAADIVPASVKTVKIVATGSIDKAVVIKGLNVTKGARAAIEAAGGRIEV